MNGLNSGKFLALVMLGLLIVGIVGLAACGYASSSPVAPAVPENKAPPASAPAASPNGISISGFAFSPAIITVPVGTTVTWTNKDSVGHTVTGDVFESKNLSRDQAFSFTFNQPGTFQYTCAYHAGMKGTVVVTQ